MVSSPSRLNSQHHELVLDASVIINILGSASPALVLRQLGREVFADELAIAEVKHCSNGCNPNGVLDELRSEGLITVLRMNDEVYAHFLSLVGATPPNDLDDGEAATLAQAQQNGFVAVIDERKGTRIAGSLKPPVASLNSMDIFAAPELLSAFSEETLSDLLYLALRNARMRVPPPFRDWVVQLLGEEKLRQCVSVGHCARRSALGKS